MARVIGDHSARIQDAATRTRRAVATRRRPGGGRAKERLKGALKARTLLAQAGPGGAR